MESSTYNPTPNRSSDLNPRQLHRPLDDKPQRPISFYDNFRSNNGTTSVLPTVSNDQSNDSSILAVPLNESSANGDMNDNNDSEQGDSANQDRNLLDGNNTPSLAYSLNTTVPQNLSAAAIAGRHTPTRNSLRHSRMIVLSRTGKDKYNSSGIVMRKQRLARALVGLQTVFGTTLCILALWLLIWAPNLGRRDNPYWSGLPLLLSGIVGLLLLGCCKKRLYKNTNVCCVTSSKILSIFLSTAAGLACFTACIFGLIHLIALSSMFCEPEFTLNTTCTCRSMQNSTFLRDSYHYVDLNCPEVDGIFTSMMILSCAINGIASVIAFSYVYLHWKSSRTVYTYTTVQTSDNRKVVIDDCT